MKPHYLTFRRKPIRLPGHDYSSPGYYFITTCTHHRQKVLGHIEDGKMILSAAGLIVQEEWGRSTGERQGISVSLDEFCIMPDHFHAIVILGTPFLPNSSGQLPRRTSQKVRFCAHTSVLGTILKGFKASCTRQIREVGLPDFKWQRSFYDHIIRDCRSLNRIRSYIKNNPANWKHDFTS